MSNGSHQQHDGRGSPGSQHQPSPSQGSDPRYFQGAPGYYGAPPSVHVHLPPKKRAVWPWVVLLLVLALPAGCTGLALTGWIVGNSRPDQKSTPPTITNTIPETTPFSPSVMPPPQITNTNPEAPFSPTSPPTSSALPGARQITYSITGTKDPGDIVTVTYTDASGRSRTQRNVYIPWSLTITPISSDVVGSIQASSLLLVSRLNCSITADDGTVLSSSTVNSAQVSC